MSPPLEHGLCNCLTDSWTWQSAWSASRPWGMGSFHFLLLRTFILGTWVSCVRGSPNCLGESSLYQFPCHVNEPSCEWVSFPATSILNALWFPCFQQSKKRILMVSPKLSSTESKIYASGENAISSGLWKVTKKPPYQMNQTGFVKSTSNYS